MRIRWGFVVLGGLVVVLGWIGREVYRVARLLREPPPLVRTPNAPAPESRGAIAQGELIGFRNALGAHVYRGIPYAQPPVGELRWKAPRPPLPFSAPHEATGTSPFCTQ